MRGEGRRDRGKKGTKSEQSVRGGGGATSALRPFVPLSLCPFSYCTSPLVSRMKAVSRLTGSSMNLVTRKPLLMSTLGRS